MPDFIWTLGIGDAAVEPVDILECRNGLGFAGIGNSVGTISREQQFASLKLLQPVLEGRRRTTDHNSLVGFLNTTRS